MKFTAYGKAFWNWWNYHWVCFILIGQLVYVPWNYLKYNTTMYSTMITEAATLPDASPIWHAEFGIYTSKYLAGVSPM